MSNFNWARFLGDALPVVKENLTLIPEAIKADKAFEQGEVQNDDLWGEVNRMIDGATSDERFKTQLADNFGIAPEEVDTKLRSFLREAKDGENPEDYMNSIGEGFQNLIRTGFKEDQDPSILSTFLTQDTQGFFGDDVYAKQKERKKAHELKDYRGKVATGKVSTDEDGNEVSSPYSQNELLTMSRDMGIDNPEGIPEYVEGVKQWKGERFKNNLEAAMLYTFPDDTKLWDKSDNELRQTLVKEFGMTREEAQEMADFRNLDEDALSKKLEIDGKVLNNAKKKAEIKVIKQKIKAGNTPDVSDAEETTSEELRAEASKLETQYRELFNASKERKKTSNPLDQKKMQARLKDMESMIEGLRATADSVDAQGGSIPSKDRPALTRKANNEVKGKSIYDDFKDSKRRFKDVAKFAADRGMEVTTSDAEFSPTGVVTMTDGNEVIRLNLLNGEVTSMSRKEQMDESLQTTPTESVNAPSLGVVNSTFTPNFGQGNNTSGLDKARSFFK